MNKAEARKKYEEILRHTILPGGDPNFESVVKELYGYIQVILSKTLYRFRKCDEHSFEALLNDRIYFNTPNKFNDPYDCLIYINKEAIKKIEYFIENYDLKSELIKMRNGSHLPLESFYLNSREPNEAYYEKVKTASEAEFEELLLNADNINRESMLQKAIEIIENIKNAIHAVSREDNYIACFSEKIRSILMWSHYSDYHTGFALGYSGINLLCLQPCMACENKCINEYNLALYPVLYGDTRVDATEQVLERFGNYIHSQQLNEKLPFINPDNLFNRKLYSFKEKSWSYEKEWRLIRTCKDLNTPYRSIVSPPNEIYLGSKISKINKKIILDLVKDKNIKIFEMYEDSNSQRYNLSFREISAR